MARERRHGVDQEVLNLLMARAKARLRFANSFNAFPSAPFYNALIKRILATNTVSGPLGDIRTRPGAIDVFSAPPQEDRVGIIEEEVPHVDPVVFVPQEDGTPPIPEPPPTDDSERPAPKIYLSVDDYITLYTLFADGTVPVVTVNDYVRHFTTTGTLYIDTSDGLYVVGTHWLREASAQDSLQVADSVNYVAIDETDNIQVSSSIHLSHILVSDYVDVTGVFGRTGVNVTDYLSLDSNPGTGIVRADLLSIDDNATVSTPYFPVRVSDYLSVDSNATVNPFYPVRKTDNVYVDASALVKAIVSISASDNVYVSDEAKISSPAGEVYDHVYVSDSVSVAPVIKIDQSTPDKRDELYVSSYTEVERYTSIIEIDQSTPDKRDELYVSSYAEGKRFDTLIEIDQSTPPKRDEVYISDYAKVERISFPIVSEFGSNLDGWLEGGGATSGLSRTWGGYGGGYCALIDTSAPGLSGTNIGWMYQRFDVEEHVQYAVTWYGRIDWAPDNLQYPVRYMGSNVAGTPPVITLTPDVINVYDGTWRQHGPYYFTPGSGETVMLVAIGGYSASLIDDYSCEIDRIEIYEA